MRTAILEYLRDNLEIVGDEASSILNSYFKTLDSHMSRLKTAIAEFDIPAVRMLTHALTGCSGNIGAAEIVRLSVEINRAAHALDRERMHSRYLELADTVEKLKNS